MGRERIGLERLIEDLRRTDLLERFFDDLEELLREGFSRVRIDFFREDLDLEPPRLDFTPLSLFFKRLTFFLLPEALAFLIRDLIFCFFDFVLFRLLLTFDLRFRLSAFFVPEEAGRPGLVTPPMPPPPPRPPPPPPPLLLLPPEELDELPDDSDFDSVLGLELDSALGLELELLVEDDEELPTLLIVTLFTLRVPVLAAIRIRRVFSSAADITLLEHYI